MNLVCPECRGELGLLDAESAQCLVHGGKFRVLFHRGSVETPSPVPVKSGIAAPESHAIACVGHPDAEATTVCVNCGDAICGTCRFPRGDGTSLCPKCAAQPQRVRRPVAAVARQYGECALHPGQPAYVRCDVCGASMCQTCNFTLPGNQHACPKCVGSAATRGLSPKRKKMVIASGALAVWSVLAFGVFIIGIAPGLSTETDQQALGVAMMFLVLGPSIAGAAFGFGALDSRRGNSFFIWVAAIGNLLLVIGFLLLSLAGSLNG